MPRIITFLAPKQAEAQLERAYKNLHEVYARRKAWKDKHGADNADLVADHRDALSYLDSCICEWCAAHDTPS